jgi:hypothetical protein
MLLYSDTLNTLLGTRSPVAEDPLCCCNVSVQTLIATRPAHNRAVVRQHDVRNHAFEADVGLIDLNGRVVDANGTGGYCSRTFSRLPSPLRAKERSSMATKVKSLDDLLTLVIANPDMARELKSDPQRIAGLFGLSLTADQAKRLSSNLDIAGIDRAAKEVDGMPAKVAQGIGLRGTASR